MSEPAKYDWNLLMARLPDGAVFWGQVRFDQKVFPVIVYQGPKVIYQQ